MKKVLAILGPTSTGKTDVGLYFAKIFGGEVVSCDSRQVYKGLDWGTGKLPGGEVDVEKGDKYWKMDGVKVWMLDVSAPTLRYDVAQYVKEASGIVREISNREKLPIVVGGTGLYFRGLVNGMSRLDVPNDGRIRGELEKMEVSNLQKKLQHLSPTLWESLNDSDRKNKRRLVRKIEISMYGGYIWDQDFPGLANDFYILKVGLRAPKEYLDKRIDERLKKRIDLGLIEEGYKLLNEGVSLERMRELGLEYAALADLLAGKTNKEEMIEVLKVKIHQYAKRQMTWFKKESGISWFDITQDNWMDQLEKYISKWYHSE